MRCVCGVLVIVFLFVQAMSCRLQITESLLQKAEEEQGASEAGGDKLVTRAVTLMDSMAALVQRYWRDPSHVYSL